MLVLNNITRLQQQQQHEQFHRQRVYSVGSVQEDKKGKETLHVNNKNILNGNLILKTIFHSSSFWVELLFLFFKYH